MTSADGRIEGHEVVSREAVIWAFRFFIGREPSGEDEISFHRQHANFESLRLAFSLTPEFADYSRLHKPQPYRVPLFMLQQPVDRSLPWRFAAPSLSRPVSQLCTNAQFFDPLFVKLCNAMHLIPTPHRKLWEFCYILSVLGSEGMLECGHKGLGFGVGEEPLPAVFSARQIKVTATHARELVGDIPDDLEGHDFCWSSCALERLGSLEHGLRFVEASLRTLRPGGCAVHTAWFNLSSNEETFESPALSIYRKRDIEALASRLRAAGHEVLPLNFHPGAAEIDEYIDLPPYERHPVKIQVARYAVTSIGVAVRKASSPN